MAHAIEALNGAVPHCEACAARAGDSSVGIVERARHAVVAWLARINGTPVADITRGDLGAIRRLAEA